MSDEGDSSSKGSSNQQDVLFVHSPAPSGDGYRVIRARNDAIEVGEIRAMKEGQPIHGEVVKLSSREGAPRLFDVDVLVPGPSETPAESPRSGPPKIATTAYRSGWDATFGRKLPAGELN